MMLPQILCVALVAVAVLSKEEEGSCPVGGASCGEAYHWPQQKGNVNRTGLSPFVGPRALEAGPTWKWIDPHVDVNRMTPLIDDKLNIYVTTASGRIYKFSPDGDLLWKHTSPQGATPAVPALMDGLLLGAARNGVVFALDMETGRERWAVKVCEQGTAVDTSSVFAINGTIIAPAQPSPTNLFGGNHRIVALERDGSVRWTYSLEVPSYNFQGSAPGDGTLVFQDEIGGLYRLRLDDGSEVWRSGLPERHRGIGTTGGTVVGPNGLVFSASNYVGGGVIHAYKLGDGSPVWRRDVGLAANQAVAVGELAGSAGLSVVAGVGENPGMPLFFRYLEPSIGYLPGHLKALRLVVGLLSWPLCCIRCGSGGCRRRSCCGCCKTCLLLAALSLSLPFALHALARQCREQPAWLWGSRTLPAQLIALGAEDGALRWSFTPPAFGRLACASDSELLMARLFQMFFVERLQRGDPICLPDCWAQAIVDAEGTSFAGFQDGRLYAVRDEDGNGRIEGSQEVRAYDLGSGFQASQALAPGLLAVVPCGGGLYVWKS